ncbi:MAG TPA: tetratricopeptide repeat protein, partial [Tepidisphaeraceae bacterium]
YRASVETELSGDAGDEKKLSLLPGGEVVVDYQDTKQPDPGAVERVMYLALASDAEIKVLNANYFDEVSEVRLGEPVYVQVTDYDQDRSAAQDQLPISVKSANGDTLTVMLTETEPHSGIFRGKFQTDYGKPNGNDDVLQADYSGNISIAYSDYFRLTSSSPSVKLADLKITGGADGSVEIFSRQFRDARDEMQLWYRTGQSAYQIGRRLYTAGALARAEEYLTEANDYFGQLVARFPDDALAASANYYLGNILSLKGNHREALNRFQEVVSKWPKSEFVPRAQFKIGEAYEGLGQFDQAADAYVLLTYHYPTDAHVPMAMVRMMNYYARSQQWADAVAIAQKFVEKFPRHDQAGAVALKAGQWLSVAGMPDKALVWYISAEKTFAANDKDMPGLLYWHAATLIGGEGGAAKGRAGQKGEEKIRELLNRCVYDYPASEYASLARIALDQITAR